MENLATRRIAKSGMIFPGVVSAIGARIRAFVHELRVRRAIVRLHQFDDRLLADIGVKRDQIELAVRGRLHGIGERE